MREKKKRLHKYALKAKERAFSLPRGEEGKGKRKREESISLKKKIKSPRDEGEPLYFYNQKGREKRHLLLKQGGSHPAARVYRKEKRETPVIHAGKRTSYLLRPPSRWFQEGEYSANAGLIACREAPAEGRVSQERKATRPRIGASAGEREAFPGGGDEGTVSQEIERLIMRAEKGESIPINHRGGGTEQGPFTRVIGGTLILLGKKKEKFFDRKAQGKGPLPRRRTAPASGGTAELCYRSRPVVATPLARRRRKKKKSSPRRWGGTRPGKKGKCSRRRGKRE